MILPKKLILASSSPYRRQQLLQLGLKFECLSPEIDESIKPQESIQMLVIRLSIEKAQAIQNKRPEAIIIGSDQSAELDGHPLCKPVTAQAAIEQLKKCSGKTIRFYTGLCVLGPSSRMSTSIITTDVAFRALTLEQIKSYIKKESPLNCAGSFKCEGLGIALFKAISSDDPSALVGLPLIALTQSLQEMGIDVLCS